MIDITATLFVGVSYSVSASLDSNTSIDWYEFNIHTKIRDANGNWLWERLDGTADKW